MIFMADFEGAQVQEMGSVFLGVNPPAKVNLAGQPQSNGDTDRRRTGSPFAIADVRC